ncbi:MAG: hypothetical protein IOD05_17850 [Rhodobacter sp.]|nr:hypothetical protein [Rhodobacter sp.]
MTNWIKHNGGPQPVADDVFVQPALEPHDENESNIGPAAWFNWDRIGYYRVLLREIRQHGVLADPRWVSISRTHIEQGAMALRRALYRPNEGGTP